MQLPFNADLTMSIDKNKRPHLSRYIKRSCGGYSTLRGRIPCRKRSCCAEGALNSTAIKAAAITWDLDLQEPRPEAAYFTTIVFDGLMSWSVFDEARKKVVRVLRDRGVLYLLAADFSTVGLHLALVLFRRADRRHEFIEIERLEDKLLRIARQSVPGATAHTGPVEAPRAVVNYILGHRTGQKRWILPASLSRKQLTWYSSALLSAPLWRVQQSFLRAVREGEAPSPWPSKARLDRFHRDLLTTARDRSMPLIERMDGAPGRAVPQE